MIFIIPKGIKGIPFVLFFAGIILAVALYMDAKNYGDNMGSVVNVSEVNYDELPEDTKYFVLDKVKVIDAEPEQFPSIQYYCLGEFKDGESNTHYVRIILSPGNKDYEKVVNSLDSKGEITGTIYLTGTYVDYDANSAVGHRTPSYRPSELIDEKNNMTLCFRSDDLNYGNEMNGYFSQTKMKTYLASVISLAVAIISAVAFVKLVKAGK